jgi:hypothetical protein
MLHLVHRSLSGDGTGDGNYLYTAIGVTGIGGRPASEQQAEKKPYMPNTDYSYFDATDLLIRLAARRCLCCTC